VVEDGFDRAILSTNPEGITHAYIIAGPNVADGGVYGTALFNHKFIVSEDGTYTTSGPFSTNSSIFNEEGANLADGSLVVDIGTRRTTMDSLTG
jgi:hypothetical protein